MPKLRVPIMLVSVTTPDEFLGDVMGDLNARGGRVEGMEPQADNLQVVVARVPQAELVSYAEDLKALTQGRGQFVASFSHHELTDIDDEPDDGAGVPSPIKPRWPPTRSSGAAAEPPPPDLTD
jgi:translation elongation factor EF-G